MPNNNSDTDESSSSSSAVDFDSSSSEEEQEEEEEEEDEQHYGSLSWRHTSKKSLSDWTIVIVNEQHGSMSDPYAVHKRTLSTGARSCVYFSAVFECRFKESQDQTSRITLPKLAADEFPQFLDYVYGNGDSGDDKDNDSDDFQIVAESAVPLFYIADRLGNSSLQQKVKDFFTTNKNKSKDSKDDEDDDDEPLSCTTTINFEECHICYQHAKSLLCENVLKLLKSLCAREISERAANRHACPIIEVADTRFWLEVFEERRKKNKKKGNVDEKLDWIMEICEHHKEDMTIDEFRQLTSEAYMDTIDPGFAVPFLKLEERITGTTTPTPPTTTATAATAATAAVAAGGAGDAPEAEADEQKTLALTSLQRRCVNAMSKRTTWMHKKDDLDYIVTRPTLSACLLLQNADDCYYYSKQEQYWKKQNQKLSSENKSLKRENNNNNNNNNKRKRKRRCNARY